MKQRVFGKVFDTSLPVGIGIDQSYSGFAISALTENGVYRTTVTSFTGKGADRLSAIVDHVRDELIGYKITDVAMEGYAYGSQMSHMLGELGGVLKLTLKHDFGIYPIIVPPTSLKKYVTGKGNAGKKSQMLLNVYKKWGVEFTDDNAADSYALARIALGLKNTEYEQDVLIALQEPKHREGDFFGI